MKVFCLSARSIISPEFAKNFIKMFVLNADEFKK